MRLPTGKFVQQEVVVDACDWCKNELTDENWISWDATYSSYGDEMGNKFDVCSLKCLREYLYSRKTHTDLEVTRIVVTPEVAMEIAY